MYTILVLLNSKTIAFEAKIWLLQIIHLFCIFRAQHEPSIDIEHCQSKQISRSNLVVKKCNWIPYGGKLQIFGCGITRVVGGVRLFPKENIRIVRVFGSHHLSCFYLVLKEVKQYIYLDNVVAKHINLMLKVVIFAKTPCMVFLPFFMKGEKRSANLSIAAQKRLHSGRPAQCTKC